MPGAIDLLLARTHDVLEKVPFEQDHAAKRCMRLVEIMVSKWNDRERIMGGEPPLYDFHDVALRLGAAGVPAIGRVLEQWEQELALRPFMGIDNTNIGTSNTMGTSSTTHDFMADFASWGHIFGMTETA